jgi:pimeloyl-ACP methyl ester carboxylesterase
VQKLNPFRLTCSFGEIYCEHYTCDEHLPNIVFLHDSLGCTQLWRDFPQKFGEKFQMNVLVFDRIGYGKSGAFPEKERKKDYMETEAHRLKELLDLIGWKEVFLFGHSDGGTIALLFSALYPSQSLGVITEGAHIYVDDLTLKGVAAAKAHYESSDMRLRLEKYHGENTVPLFYAWVNTWLSDWYRDWNILSKLKSIHCPVLAIQGTKDEFGLPQQALDIAQSTNGLAKSIFLKDLGHNPHKENATETMSIVENWLSSHE